MSDYGWQASAAHGRWMVRILAGVAIACGAAWADGVPDFARNLRLSSILVVGGETRVGIVDTETRQAFFLRPGERIRGIELIEADAGRERAILRYGDADAVLPLLGMPRPGPTPAAAARATAMERAQARRQQFAELRERVAALRAEAEAAGANRAQVAALVNTFVRRFREEGHFAEATERADGTYRMVLRGDTFTTGATVGTPLREMTPEERAAERAQMVEQRNQANEQRRALMAQVQELRGQLEAVADQDAQRQTMIHGWVEQLRRDGYVVMSTPQDQGRHRVYIVDARVSFLTHL